MADCQLGCYATFSGFDDAMVERYRELDMTVTKFPRTIGFEWDAARHREAIELTTSLDPDFAVIGGDLIDDLSDQKQIDAFQDISRGFTPLRLVPGNHDVAWDATVPSPDALSAYRSEFGPDRYRFDHEEDSFIVVNTTIWANPQMVPEEHTQQLSFLEESLIQAAEARHRVILGHHPLFVSDADEPNSYWSIPNPLRSELLAMFERYSVGTFFAGHWHRNGGGRHKTLDMVVTGPVGFPLGRDPSGLRVVDVDATGVKHKYMALPRESETE